MQFDSGITRRCVLKMGATAAALPLVACASGGQPDQQSRASPSAKLPAATLRLGVAGAARTDSLDPATYVDTFCINVGRQIMNGLVEYDDQGRVAPELFESWEVEPGAANWVFKVRSGVEFHNGKTLVAEDVVYSINRHRSNSLSMVGNTLHLIKDVRAVGTGQVRIDLHEGNADLLHVLGDYHLLVVPDAFTDWRRPVGTGAFKFESFEPGARAIAVRQANYWKAGRARVEAVETIAMNDDGRRIAALLDGNVDAINRVSPTAAKQIGEHSGAGIKRTPGRYHVIAAMQTNVAPFDSIDVRRALKFGIDRQALLESLFGGYGSIGNDHPIAPIDPNFNSELAQTVFDPDMARHHLRKAGLDRLDVQLHASEAAFQGATKFARAFADSAEKAGVKIEVVVGPANTFWDRVWMKTPFCTSYWGGRPAATQMFDVAYRSNAGWNETRWRSSTFDSLLASAKTELDEQKRRQYLWQLQAMLHEDGGAIIPAFKDWVDGVNDRVQGVTAAGPFDLCDGRIAERVWLNT